MAAIASRLLKIKYSQLLSEKSQSQIENQPIETFPICSTFVFLLLLHSELVTDSGTKNLALCVTAFLWKTVNQKMVHKYFFMAFYGKYGTIRVQNFKILSTTLFMKRCFFTAVWTVCQQNKQFYDRCGFLSFHMIYIWRFMIGKFLYGSHSA